MKVKRLKNLLKMNESEVMNYVCSFLEKYHYKYLRHSEYVIAMGDIPVCLVAHIDTVWGEIPYEVYHDRINKILWSPYGLGADDRAGVAAILEIVERGLRPHIIFTRGEEIGGIGAFHLISDFEEPPLFCNFIIELDRSGYNDCVFYGCQNEQFKNFIEEFGFIEDQGSFSDIYFIAPQWNTAAVNLSIGYMNEHFENEFLNLKWYKETINKVYNILTSGTSTIFTYNDNKEG